MKQHRKGMRAFVGLAVIALVLTACRGGGESDASGTPGVTSDPCPNAVNPDNGCIYLGVISDLTKGPFAPLALPVTDAQKAFWKRVNEQGGVGGYDIDISKYVADAEYNPEIHNRKYQEMRNEILAMAQTLGSTQTITVIEDMRADKMLGVPASWNSAWQFEEQILPVGANYCFEGMNSIDWAVANKGIKAGDKVVHVGFPNDYGGDAAVGVEVAAKANGLDFVKIETPSGQDNQAGAIAAIKREEPQLVFISTGPAEMATIVGQLAAGGWKGVAMGNGPTWNGALLQSAAAPALKAQYVLAGPWAHFGSDTPGHQAMRDAIGSDITPNIGYIAGWTLSYPMLAALEAAAEMDGGINRENVMAAANALTEVDFEGILPPEAGNRNEPYRATYFAGITDEEPGGNTSLEDAYVGPTAKAYDFTKPCFSLY